MSTSPDKCLRCETAVDAYWFTFGLPGAYCTECIDFVMMEHEYLSRLADKLVESFQTELIKRIKDKENV